MKRILVGHHREPLLATLEIILRHWGYRVLAAARTEQIAGFLTDVPPDLLLLEGDLLDAADESFGDHLRREVDRRELPVVLLGKQPPIPSDIAREHLELPINIFSLFTLVQGHLEATPRRNLRLKLQLPGMFYADGHPCLAEVLSLSARGLFIKTGCRVDRLDRLQVVFPLLGMKTEVEVEGRVIYRVHPGPENNYMQGVGIEFIDNAPETQHILEDFLQSRLLGELAETRSGARDLDVSQLQSHGHDMTLKVTPAGSRQD